MPFSAEMELKRLSKRMDILKKRGDIPSTLLELVDTVYRRQLVAREEAIISLPTKEQLASDEQHAQGAPLIEREHFPFDRVQAETLFKEFLGLLTNRDDALGEAGRLIAQDMNNNDLDLDTAFAAHLSGDEAFFEAVAQRTPDAPRTLTFLVQASLSPSISAAAKQINDAHASQAVWSHGHCPVCASLPLIGELREKAGFRYVNCSFCATSYRVPRMACAYCGETDAQKLAYFTTDDETGYRVEICESCKMYIKSTDFRELDKTALPLIDDLESLSLDILAGNEGYSRPTLSGLGF